MSFKDPLSKPVSVRGFTLIEMAVVLLILGTLLGGLLGAIAQVSENTRRSTARNDLERIADALYGFAQANGYLPCPATSTSDGFESPAGGGDCTAQHGFVPVASLSFAGRINDDTLLLDPWANPYRYSVSERDSSGGDRSFTSRDGLRVEFSEPPLDNTDMLRVCEDSTNCATTIVTDLVPAILFSMGENWASFTSADETENGGGDTDGAYTISASEDFVNTTYIEDEYDDILLWLSPYLLFTSMIDAGRLP